MASVDPVADNKGFAEKEGADFPLLSDPTKETAKAYGVLEPPRDGQPLDVLYREGRPDRRDRHGREAPDVRRRHDREAHRVEGRTGEVANSNSQRGTSWISNSLGQSLPVTNSRSLAAS